MNHLSITTRARTTAFMILRIAAFLTVINGLCGSTFALTIEMMGSRIRRRVGQVKKLPSTTTTTIPSITSSSSSLLNRGRGPEITGVTLPKENCIQGWELLLGSRNDNNNNINPVRVVAAQVQGRYYALQGACPRCGFDLWKGDLISTTTTTTTSTNAKSTSSKPLLWEDLPRIACPTCSTTYSMVSGRVGPPLPRTGLAGWVGNIAKTATSQDACKNAQAFVVTTVTQRDTDDDNDNNGLRDRVYLRER